jgi:ABC-type multidrug transport system fused ATPase/permease subunit
MTFLDPSVKRTWALLDAPERRGAIALLGLMALGMALETLCTGLVLPAMALMTQPDLVLGHPRVRTALEVIGSPSHSQLIILAMIGLVALYLAKNAFLALLAWRQTRFAYGVQARLSQRLFATYLHQPYTFHLQRNSAQLIRNLTREVGMYTEALLGSLAITTELLVFAGIAALLLLVEPVGTIAAVLIIAGAGWTFHRVTRARVSRWGEARQFHDGLRFQHLQQGLAGARDVKLLGREGEFLAQFRAHNTRSAQVAQRQATLRQLPRLWLELLAVMGLAALVIAMLLQGRLVAAIVPTLGLFAAAAFRLMPSMTRILAGAQTLRFASPAIEVLTKELELDAEAHPSPTRRAPAGAGIKHEVRLGNVSYTYPAATTPSLTNADLRIRKGEIVGIVGPSGSGKSTLVDVFLGLLAPSAGEVTVDGRDIRQDLRAWQDHIGYVPQSIYLTDDTLRRNVAFGLPAAEIDDAAVMRALRAARLDEFVATLPRGLDTVVGERGVRLSGGQRQRIGVARALYHDPDVLVLDEATSALDTATEHGVLDAVEAMRGEKTIVIVAHRLSTVERCDRVYRLEQSRVVAEGSARSVLAADAVLS